MVAHNHTMLKDSPWTLPSTDHVVKVAPLLSFSGLKYAKSASNSAAYKINTLQGCKRTSSPLYKYMIGQKPVITDTVVALTSVHSQDVLLAI